MKKHFPLIAGIAIPVLMILFVAASIYLPGIFIKPKYNFLYLSGPTYDSQEYYVTDGQLQMDSATGTSPSTPNELFVYDVATDQSAPISFQAAQKLSLDTRLQSPDGFEVVGGGDNGGFFPFFGGDYDYGMEYLKGHDVSRKLNLPDQSEYSENFMFLGWINDNDQSS